MFANLIPQEVVNGIKGGRVLCLDHDACSRRRFSISVLDFPPESLHSACARRDRIVHHPGNPEVARGKGGGDVLEVLANLTEVASIVRVVGLNLDDASVGPEQEMVGGLRLFKTHGGVPAAF